MFTIVVDGIARYQAHSALAAAERASVDAPALRDQVQSIVDRILPPDTAVLVHAADPRIVIRHHV